MSKVKPFLQRAGALFLALLFLGTTLAFTIFILLQGNNANKTSQKTNDQSTKKENTMKLEGTKLAGFTPVTTVSDLQIIDLKEGTGEAVKPGAKVTAHYTGALAKDGTIFQSSHDTGQPVPFSLNGVIKGWTDGVPGMKVGGTRRLVIPAAMAYGSTPPAGSGIPPNADMVFDIEMVSVQQ